jgi:hypothetical protein
MNPSSARLVTKPFYIMKELTSGLISMIMNATKGVRGIYIIRKNQLPVIVVENPMTVSFAISVQSVSGNNVRGVGIYLSGQPTNGTVQNATISTAE